MMSLLNRKTWQYLFQRDKTPVKAVESPSPARVIQTQMPQMDLAPNDPLLVYLLSGTEVVEIDKLEMDSPGLRTLKQAGVKIAVPLISQGELIGLLNLGPRRSEQDYSTDDRRLLNTLATQAAPALRVAQLVQEQQAEARERERMEQELRVARVIQQTLLPKEVPAIPGWRIATHWQPARAVSGDFYDFIYYPDGRLGLVIADVTDKGVPAALVMATTRSILRSSAERLESPGQILQQVNNLLFPDIPPKMFVTCLYAVLDPVKGSLRYANAGQNLPYLRTAHGMLELRASGMPLGLMPDMTYEEKEVSFAPGDCLLLSSDGLVEAHNPQREMFSFPRLKALVASETRGEDLIGLLMDQWAEFTGPGYEQEDDITLLVLEQLSIQASGSPEVETAPLSMASSQPCSTLVEFSVPSQPGGERQATARVLAAADGLNLSQDRRQRLETAVAEAIMNAMEHGNHYQAELPVQIQVCTSGEQLVTRITDQGGREQIPEVETPDLEAKLAGLQSPRGWGLFLIKNMVDDLRVSGDENRHTVELMINLKEG